MVHPTEHIISIVPTAVVSVYRTSYSSIGHMCSQTWPISPAPITTQARIWARTSCSFDGAGRSGCQTSGCNGLLECQDYGKPPNTLAEYALNQFNNLDFFDISLVDRFNVVIEFSPTFNGCTQGIKYHQGSSRVFFS
ncbi:hypothetical protein HYC85_015692 [Camellia sinensis]|uniref:Uncharacterized protein n=1 Tax=Camellia sinensis TaxID=4442 RepID=A0A7J7H143_CAMSI|nr:hypothetical protein HYC85_015692 [Camellia sinensis]